MTDNKVVYSLYDLHKGSGNLTLTVEANSTITIDHETW